MWRLIIKSWLFSFLLLNISVVPTWGGEAADALGVDMSALIGRPDGDPISGTELDRQTEEVASIMRCPVCQGLSVADSSTLSAMAIKGQVKGFLGEGYSQTQVLTYFEQSYGEFIRLEPKVQGFNLVVWIAPILVFLIGITLILSWIRKSKGTTGAQGGATEVELESYLERVRRETA
jgi:cytochrome c-type biogenesis protein CcmH